jgi:hypothetical protein
MNDVEEVAEAPEFKPVADFVRREVKPIAKTPAKGLTRARHRDWKRILSLLRSMGKRLR